MSYFIVGVLVPGYEDYDQYGCRGNAFAGFPQLWPEEKAAESGIYREWKKMRELGATMRRAGQLSILVHPEPQSIVERALVSIAREEGWRVANPLEVERLGVSPIYSIPADEDTEEDKPTRWEDIVRWMDRAQTKREQLAEMERKNAPRLVKHQDFQIDFQRLVDFMGDLMPIPVPQYLKGRRAAKLLKAQKFSNMSVTEQALVSLAMEEGWHVSNSNQVKDYGVSAIYATRPGKY